MGDYEWLGLAIVVGLVGLIAAMVRASRVPPAVKTLILAALALRVIGAVLRHGVLYYVYGGVGDAAAYYGRGLAYADQFREFDFSAFTASEEWQGGKWWGTQFVSFPSGLVLTFIGPTMRGEFIVFALLAFIGLVGFGAGFRRSFPNVPVTDYLRWIWLFPSLWFWPSSVGKDALILMGLGISVAGYVGPAQRIRWPILAIGLAVVFAVRPQVAAVTVVSLILAHWASTVGDWRPQKVMEALLILTAGMATVALAMRQLGADGFDAEGVGEYIANNSGRGDEGGSAIDEVGPGFSGIPIGLVNILFRPFPWEATNVMMLFSSAEIWGFWVLAWMRRKAIWPVLRDWRSNRLTRVAIPFVLIYSTLLGMLIANQGIIARQRIFVFPFLFVLFAAATVHKPRPQTPTGAAVRGRRIARPPQSPAPGSSQVAGNPRVTSPRRAPS